MGSRQSQRVTGSARPGSGVLMAGVPGVRPYFFLSYARTPRRDLTDREDPDRWVHKLYKDLCDEILQITDASPEEAGFMDRENQVGTEWSPALTAALGSCRVFVPLYSRRYFESDNCGREWFAFAQRELNHNARRNGRPVRAIVPALYTRVPRDRLPDVASAIQYDHTDFGPRYISEGFYGIMKLHSYRPHYQRAVKRLAERIVQVADDTNLPFEQPGRFETLSSPFGRGRAMGPLAEQLHIMVLAHSRGTLPDGRDPGYYGDTPSLWSPYQPDYPQPLVDYAREHFMRCLGREPLIGSFPDSVPYWTSQSQEMPPSLCLVDAWVVFSDAYTDSLRQLNELPHPWMGVLVPWNRDDTDLAKAAPEIR